MNGARSTFMRKGYLLTALAAAVLLAASSGTAWAQVTVTAPKTVAEDGNAMITVIGRASIPGGTNDPTTVTVTVTASPGTATPNTSETPAEPLDFSQNLGTTATLNFPANTGTSAVTSTQSATPVVQTSNDTDAEDERVLLTSSAPVSVCLLYTSPSPRD